MFTISNSKLKDWQRCKRLYFYRWKLNLEPKKKNINFIRGTLLHNIVEHRFNGENPHLPIDVLRHEINTTRDEDLLDKKEEIEGVIFTAELVLAELIKKPAPMGAIETEYKVECDVNRQVMFEGQVDAFGHIGDGKIAVYELKSKARPGFDPVTERFRPQAVLYAEALNQMGHKVTHILREFIYTPKMNKPELTKKGAMSRANITCTWDFYKSELVRNNLNPEDYLEMKDKLNFKVSESIKTKINPSMTEAFMNMVAYEAKQMMKETKFVRTWNFNCTMCPFKDACFMGMMDPKSEKAILNMDFKPRKSHYANEKEND